MEKTLLIPIQEVLETQIEVLNQIKTKYSMNVLTNQNIASKLEVLLYTHSLLDTFTLTHRKYEGYSLRHILFRH